MIRNIKVLAIALVCGLAGISQPASARPTKVEPSYYYKVLTDVKHDTLQAAYSSINPHLSTQRDPGTGLVHERVVGMDDAVEKIFYNGRRANQGLKWESLQYNPKTKSYDTWVPRPKSGHNISMIPECPKAYRMVAENYTTTATGRTVDYICIAEGSQPEPDCDPCNNPSKPVPIPEKTGNPIYHSSGLKEQVEVDYQSNGPGGLKFVRIYRSDRNGWEHNYQITGMDLNKTQDPAQNDPLPERPRSAQCYWALANDTGKMRCFRPMFSALANDFSLQRGNGSVIKFGNATNLNPAANVNDRWTPVYGPDGAKIANEVYNATNDSTERFGLDGYIQTITSRGGLVQTFTYAASPAGSDVNSPPRLLQSVEDPYGRALTFTHDSAGRIETMTTPEGGIYKYVYYAFNSVSSVTYPDEKVRTYLYNEPAFTDGADLPFALTGIIDENGARYATYTYDFTGKALSTEHAGGVEKYRFNYHTDATTVTEPLGADVVYSYTKLFEVRRSISQDQPAGAGSKAARKSIVYDGKANISTYTDVNGRVTAYTYDARNLELTRTQKSGTPQIIISTITTEWHPRYRLPLRIAEPKRLTVNTYFPNGDLNTRTIHATTDEDGSKGMLASKTGSARTWTYTYNARGQIETVTGPRADVLDKTIFAYDAVTGDLASITNAAGHITRFAEYNGDGQVGLVTAPNGVRTRLAYTPRGWLESTAVSDGVTTATTTYQHDGVGQIKTITLPDQSVINYTYDDAHRLTGVIDSRGNKIHYVLDNMGNRIKEEVSDPSGQLARQIKRTFDVLNRLQEQTGGAQ